MAIGCFANLIGQLFSQLGEVLEQYLAAVEIDLQPARLEQWSQSGSKAQSIESTGKARDMLTKSIHKDLRKTASAECSFFHGRSKLASPGRAFRAFHRQLSSRKMQEHFSLPKSDSYSASERRSAGQEANGINGRGPLAGRRPFMPDCPLTAAKRSGHQSATLPHKPIVVAAPPRYVICG
jgi:hypothetical protein